MAVGSIGSTSIDVSGIVSQLMTVENKSLDKYDNKISDIQSKISAYGMVMAQLSNFQMNLQPLNNLSTDKSSSDNDNVAVSLINDKSTSTAYGVYNVGVSQLAQSQRLTLANIASKDTIIGKGTLTFSFGDTGSLGTSFNPNTEKADKTITIDDSNNTLQGIRDAINKADMGVTANIINTGSSYTLAITSPSGAKNSLKISVSDLDGTNIDSSGLSQFAFDPEGIQQLTQLQGAKSAIATFDGVEVKSDTNTFTTIDGVSLTANKVGNSVVKVEKDSSTVSTAVNNFVKSFNDLNNTIKKLSNYDATNKRGGVLTGDATVRELQNKLRQSIFSEVGEVGSGQTLSSIGISFQKDGSLSLDSGKLSAALANDPGKVMRMLDKSGEIVDKNVFVTNVSEKTKAGKYSLYIDQLASAGSVSAGNAVGSFTIDASNNSIGLDVNGEQAFVSLDNGTYTASTLVTALQSKLNSAFTSNKLAVSIDGSNKLTINTKAYGSDQSVKLLPANGNSNLFGSAIETVGKDVKGSIGGTTVTGKGQLLAGVVSTGTEGLQLTVTGGAVGDRGMIYVSKGMYGLFNDLSQTLNNDTLSSKKNSLSNQISAMSKQREAQVKHLADVEKRYRTQFTALDSALSNLSQTSSYLTAQLAKL